MHSGSRGGGINPAHHIGKADYIPVEVKHMATHPDTGEDVRYPRHLQHLTHQRQFFGTGRTYRNQNVMQ